MPFNDEQLTARMRKILKKEADQPLALYYLSFVGDEGFRGAAVVEAQGPATAVRKTHLLHINPGGQVLIMRVPESGRNKIPPEAMDRLLSLRDCEEVFGPMDRLGDMEN